MEVKKIAKKRKKVLQSKISCCILVPVLGIANKSCNKKSKKWKKVLQIIILSSILMKCLWESQIKVK